jgi:hypothetical protein
MKVSRAQSLSWAHAVNQGRFLLLTTLSLFGTGCSGSVETTSYELGCETGTLGCNCYGNWSCNYQLSCVDEVCVDRKTETLNESNDKQRAAVDSPSDPLALAATTQCVQCLHDECSTALEACYPETGCIALQACLFACSNKLEQPECSKECFALASANAQAKSAPVSKCVLTCSPCQEDS